MQPTISTVGRERLIDSVDTPADVAHTIEQAVDTGRSLENPDDLIGPHPRRHRDLAFDLDAARHLPQEPLMVSGP